MYKGKWKIWAVLVGISFIFFIIKAIVSSIHFTPDTVYNVYSDLDTTLVDRFDGYSKKDAKLKVVKFAESSDVIILQSSDMQIDGYTKYTNQFYSEFMVYVQTGEYCGSSCNFISDVKENINDYYCVVDLKRLFEAYENDLTYEDINFPNTSGVHNDQTNHLDLNRKIKIYLPSKGLYYYDDVVTLIAYCLNGYSYDGIDDPALMQRVYAIIEKSDTYSSDNEISQRIFSRASEDNRDIFIAPAYIRDITYGKTTNSNYYYLSFMPSKTTELRYDMYLKTREDMEYYDNLFTSLSQAAFFNKIGLKNAEIDFNKNNVFNYDKYQ